LASSTDGQVPRQNATRSNTRTTIVETIFAEEKEKDNDCSEIMEIEDGPESDSSGESNEKISGEEIQEIKHCLQDILLLLCLVLVQ
jgi:hypothetical protein